MALRGRRQRTDRLLLALRSTQPPLLALVFCLIME
jgi:hypothetical protein